MSDAFAVCAYWFLYLYPNEKNSYKLAIIIIVIWAFSYQKMVESL